MDLSVLRNLSNGISFAELEKKLGFGNGSISKWEKSSPSIDKVVKVADFFGVSTDYLLKGEEPRAQLFNNERMTVMDNDQKQALFKMHSENSELFDSVAQLEQLASEANIPLSDRTLGSIAKISRSLKGVQSALAFEADLEDALEEGEQNKAAFARVKENL